MKEYKNIVRKNHAIVTPKNDQNCNFIFGLKLVSAIFYQIFIFHQTTALQKL